MRKLANQILRTSAIFFLVHYGILLGYIYLMVGDPAILNFSKTPPSNWELQVTVLKYSVPISCAVYFMSRAVCK